MYFRPVSPISGAMMQPMNLLYHYGHQNHLCNCHCFGYSAVIGYNLHACIFTCQQQVYIPLFESISAQTDQRTHICDRSDRCDQNLYSFLVSIVVGIYLVYFSDTLIVSSFRSQFNLFMYACLFTFWVTRIPIEGPICLPILSQIVHCLGFC